MSVRTLVAAAAGLLLSVASPAAQPPWVDVIRNLRNPKPETRLDSLQKLESAAYVGAIEPVAELITDSDDRVQAAAIDAELTFFLTERVAGSRSLAGSGSKSRAQVAFDTGPLVRGAGIAPPILISRLIAAIRDENARVRFDAVHALGFIGEAPLGASESRALALELDHYDPIIRAATARVIGRLRAAEAGDKLIAGLSDSNALVRLYAIESLGWLRHERAAAALRDLVARGRGEEPAMALFALARIASQEDRERFRQRLADKSAAMRRSALEGVARVSDRDSLEAARKMAASDSSASVKLAGAFAVQLLGGDVQTHTIASMLVVDDLTAQAREYLFELGRTAVPGIESVLKVATDSRHRADLIQAVGYVGTLDDVPTLEPFLRDRDERVSRAAGHAIARLRR